MTHERFGYWLLTPGINSTYMYSVWVDIAVV